MAASQAQAQKVYQGKPVRSCRDARAGDPDYREGGDQVVVTLQDGTEKTVRRAEVTEAPDASKGP